MSDPAAAPGAIQPAPTKASYLLVSLGVLALDQWTKWWIETTVPAHTSREILPGLFHLSHVRNTGVAFGLLATGGDWSRTLLLICFIAAVLLFVGYSFRATPVTARRHLWALALVLGGAVGNFLDRLVSGAVTDFLAVFIGSWRWPDFNVADSAIVVGVGLLLLDLFRSPAPAAKVPAASDPT
jgi:signal peptidase II